MSDNKIGPGLTQPPVHYTSGVEQKDQADQPEAKTYIQSGQSSSAPPDQSIFSRAVVQQPDHHELSQEKLERLIALASEKSLHGLEAGLANYVRTMDQFNQLMGKLPIDLSSDVMGILANHAGSLTAEEIVSVLNNTDQPLPDQLDVMGLYMVKIGAPENPVKVIAATRAENLLESTGLSSDLKASLKKRIEREALFGLSQKMRGASEQLLSEGSLNEEQQKRLKTQNRQIGIELSAYLG